jgi:hypothetical protein
MNNYYYFSRDTGWGDTLWHLTNALMYCEQNKKDILIDMRGHWASKGSKNLFGEYFQSVDSDVNVIINEEFIDQKKDSAEHHDDSKLVIKNPLKCKEDSKRFYDTFDRINIHGSIAKEIDEIRANKFSGHYVVGVHARCSNGEFLPPRKGNSKRFHGERNPIKTIFDIFSEKIDHVLFDSPRAFLKACNGYKFFVASDSKQFVDLFEERYDHTIVADRYFAPPGCGTGHEKGEKSTKIQLKMEEDYGRINIAKEALADFYLLQYTNFLFKNFSRFNEFCLYKGIPNFHINFQEKCY